MKIITQSIAILAALFLLALTCFGEDRVTLTITLTNNPVTGNTFTNQSTARYWTNYTSALTINTNVPASATNNLIERSTTNLFTALVTYPSSGNLIPGWLTATQITLIGQVGETVTASANGADWDGGWCDLTFTTQAVTRRFPVTTPLLSSLTPAQATNVASLILSDLSLLSTNLWASNALALARFVASNGVFYGRVSNSAAIGGNVYRLTNGVYWTPKLATPTFTNAVNYGNSFSSPGTGAGSDQFGYIAEASGESALAVGSGSVASDIYSVALGYWAAASDADAMAIGSNSDASGTNAVALGNGAVANKMNAMAIGTGSTAYHSNAVALGVGAATTATDQIVLGNGAHNVVMPGVLSSAAQTNSTFKGTNQVTGEWNWTATAVNTIAAGNNTLTPGATTLLHLTGNPGTNFVICSLTNWAPGKMLRIENDTGYPMTIAHESGYDSYAENRIVCPDGADVRLTGRRTVTLIYNGTDDRWVYVGPNQGTIILPSASYLTTTNVPLSDTTNATAVTYDTTAASNNGIGLVDGSKIYVSNSVAGHYLITFSAVVTKTDAGVDWYDVWLAQDGAAVDNTRTRVNLTAANEIRVVTVTFIVDVQNEAYFELMSTTDDDDMSLLAAPAVTAYYTAPAMPAMIVTINKVSD